MNLQALIDRGATVLTASRRLAHALRLAYAGQAQADGASVWRTPRILPWTAWLREQWLLHRVQHPQACAARLLSANQAQALWDDVVAGSALAERLLNTGAAAQMVARSRRRMIEFRIPLEALREHRNAEAQALYEWSGAFRQHCAAHAALDEADLLHWAETSGFVPNEPLALAGFDATVPAMQALLDRWQRSGVTVTHPSFETGAETVAVIGASDLDGEIELSARWARTQVEQGARSVGVVVPDLARRQAAIRRVFEDIFHPGARCVAESAATAPFVLAASQPLSAYPLVDMALTCLTLARGSAPSTLAGRLLRSPFIRGGERERHARALADARLREERRERWDWFELERWAGVTGCTELELAVRETNTLLRRYRGRAMPSVWSERFHSLLRVLGWPGDRARNSVEQQTMTKFQAVLAEFGTFDAFLGPLELPAAAARLRQLADATRFEPETPPAPVTLIDATTGAGMQFEALWVAGLDSTRLPEATAPDPLIPIELQRHAGMPEASAAATFALAQTRLRRLVCSAKQVVLSWPQRDGDAELRPSPLLAAWPVADIDTRSLADARPLRERLFAARPPLIVEQDDLAPPLATGTPRGGTRIFELQSRCPFRAQAELRLGAKPLARVGPQVEPIERGRLVHRVLADIWAELRDHATLLSYDENTLENRVRALAERHAIQTLQPATRHRGRLTILEIETTARQVLRLLAIDRRRRPFVVRSAEQDERFELEGLTLRLQPDRIDELEEGGALLIDYKLGAANTAWHWVDSRPGRPPAPQMPLYAIAHAGSLRALAYAVLAPGAVEYRGWSQDLAVAPGIAPYLQLRRRPHEAPDWAALLAHWDALLRKLARQFMRGEAQVDPLPQACMHCHLSTLCRVHERAAAEPDPEPEAAIDE